MKGNQTGTCHKEQVMKYVHLELVRSIAEIWALFHL